MTRRVVVELEHGVIVDGRSERLAVLRPARVRDELRALTDFRVCLWPEAFANVLLARVVESIGTIERVDVGVIERLRASDRARLEAAYVTMNDYETSIDGDEIPGDGVTRASVECGVTAPAMERRER